jgi:crotonobetainyl-CoA:carnitine CoA-transferase CaiB-like acyl-CoA transferase
VRKAPPLVGEDNERIYSDLLGFTQERLAELRSEGAI